VNLVEWITKDSEDCRAYKIVGPSPISAEALAKIWQEEPPLHPPTNFRCILEPQETRVGA